MTFINRYEGEDCTCFDTDENINNIVSEIITEIIDEVIEQSVEVGEEQVVYPGCVCDDRNECTGCNLTWHH